VLRLGLVYLGNDVDSSGYCTAEIFRRIILASSIMSQLDHVWMQSWLSNTYDEPKANTWHLLV